MPDVHNPIWDLLAEDYLGQIQPGRGWWYKNTSSNGGFILLSAQLARYTKNNTYAEWAEKVFDWMANSPLLEADGTVNDGTDSLTDPPCKDADHTPWTYTYGIMIGGAAYVSNPHVLL